MQSNTKKHFFKTRLHRVLVAECGIFDQTVDRTLVPQLGVEPIFTALGLAVQESGKTCTEIAKGVPELGDFNNQKVAALMRQLVEAGQATKATVKGKSVFTVA